MRRRQQEADFSTQGAKPERTPDRLPRDRSASDLAREARIAARRGTEPSPELRAATRRVG